MSGQCNMQTDNNLSQHFMMPRLVPVVTFFFFFFFKYPFSLVLEMIVPEK